MVPLRYHVVVAEQHEASLLARHGVAEQEALAAAITAVGEAERHESESQPQAVSELVRGELRAIEAIGHGCEPRPSLLRTEHPALGRSVGGGQELGEDSLIGRLPYLLGPSALEACMAPVPVGIERRPLPQGAHQEACAGLGGCEAAGGRLGWVRKTQAGFADRDGRQFALAFRLCRLQQGRQEDRADGFLDRLERRPAVRDDALQVLPLLLE